ncbi:MAG: hypothetical protein WBB28_01885 [Crinalium sp.]
MPQSTHLTTIKSLSFEATESVFAPRLPVDKGKVLEAIATVDTVLYNRDRSTYLVPKGCGYAAERGWPTLKKWGVVRYKPLYELGAENYFYECRLPTGWQIIPHDMGTQLFFLVDTKGLRRAEIYWDANDYTKETGICVYYPRFSVEMKNMVDKNLPRSGLNTKVALVRDLATYGVLYKTEQITVGDWRSVSMRDKAGEQALFDQARRWIGSNFPFYMEDANRHWNVIPSLKYLR